MIKLELTEEELTIIYNCVNGSYKHFAKKAEFVQNPDAAIAHREKVKLLRDKLRPIKTEIWREEQKIKHESSR